MPVATPGELLIAELTAAGTSIVAHLAKSIQDNLSDNVQLAHITECDFPGYEPVEITDWEDVFPEGADAAEVLSALITFTADGIVTPQSAVACYLTQTDAVNGTRLFELETFAGQFVFRASGDVLQKQIRVVSSLDF